MVSCNSSYDRLIMCSLWFSCNFINQIIICKRMNKSNQLINGMYLASLLKLMRCM